MIKYELCKQVLTEREQEMGVRCMECGKIRTNDEYYFAKFIEPDVAECICIDCGFKAVKGNL